MSLHLKKPSIVFMGTPGFAVPSLKILIDAGYKIAAVITSPDKPSGRGRTLQASAVKEFAVLNNLTVLQPENLKDPEFITELKNLNADLQVVVAFRMLPEIVWSMPPLGTFNLHASLLPQYRGAAPINHVIINSEKTTGVTTFFIDHQIDTGNVLLRKTVEIEEGENAGSLHDKLMMAGAETVLQTVELIASGNFKEIPQSELMNEGEEQKTAPKIFKEDCRINWNRNGTDIVKFIRGLSPHPTAYTILHNKENEKLVLKIYEGAFTPGPAKYPPGTIHSDNKDYMKIQVRDGSVNILSLQLQGKSRMNAKNFLSGFRDISLCRVK